MPKIHLEIVSEKTGIFETIPPFEIREFAAVKIVIKPPINDTIPMIPIFFVP